MTKASVKVRVDEELLEAIDEEADAEGLSRSAYIRRILKQRNDGAPEDKVDELEERLERIEAVHDALGLEETVPPAGPDS